MLVVLTETYCNKVKCYKSLLLHVDDNFMTKNFLGRGRKLVSIGVFSVVCVVVKNRFLLYMICGYVCGAC